MWNTEQGVELCRRLEPLAVYWGYHVALGGSVLSKGCSLKDLDIFVYPHKTAEPRRKEEFIQALEEKEKISNWDETEHRHYGDEKEVWRTKTDDNRRIDFFFVQ